VKSVALTILSVAFPFAAVGPDAVGGAEQVLTAVETAVVRAGHRSLVIACEGSVCRGTLIPTPRWNLGDPSFHPPAHEHHRRAIAEVLRQWPVDLIHLHGLDFAAYLPPPGPPVLATLHLSPRLYPREALFPSRPDTWLHAVSDSQHRDCPPGAPLLEPIPNGVDLQRLRPGPPKEGFALALGRICPEKGFHLALDAAKAAGVPLRLGGEVFPYPEHQRYFREEIEPRLDRLRQFLGPVGRERKRHLLAAARCVMVPSQTAEACPLVALEALACGTPVVASPLGALPEIVDHGRTGFLVSTIPEMAEALRCVDALDPAECRREAEQRFSADAMTARYLDLYHRLCMQMIPGA
jgi:glycosyltransferase involved in cell wall biosynthesis